MQETQPGSGKAEVTTNVQRRQLIPDHHMTPSVLRLETVTPPSVWEASQHAEHAHQKVTALIASASMPPAELQALHEAANHIGRALCVLLGIQMRHVQPGEVSDAS